MSLKELLPGSVLGAAAWAIYEGLYMVTKSMRISVTSGDHDRRCGLFRHADSHARHHGNRTSQLPEGISVGKGGEEMPVVEVKNCLTTDMVIIHLFVYIYNFRTFPSSNMLYIVL